MNIKTIASSSSANAYLIDDGRFKIMLECGMRIKKLRRHAGFRLSDIDAVLVSHAHSDHAMSAKEIMRAGIDLYTSQGTANSLKLGGHRLKVIEPLKQFKIGTTWTILPFPTEHDCPGSLGFLLQSGRDKLLFMTDTAYCRYKFSGINHIMIECNYQTEYLLQNDNYPPELKKRVMKTHFSLDNVLDFLRANDLSKLEDVRLIHLSEENAHPAEMIEAVQRVVGVPVYVHE